MVRVIAIFVFIFLLEKVKVVFLSAHLGAEEGTAIRMISPHLSLLANYLMQ